MLNQYHRTSRILGSEQVLIVDDNPTTLEVLNNLLLKAGHKTLLAKNGLQAINLLYEYYADSLYGVIQKIISDEDTAQDVLQETFVKIWRYAKKYDSSKAKLFTWLYRIAYNTAIDKVRSQKNKSVLICKSYRKI